MSNAAPASSTSLDLDAPASESLALIELPAPDVRSLTAARARRLEFSCRGDRARLDVLAPEGAEPFPTLLVQPNPHDDGELASCEGLSAWLAGGVAVASVTLPLFGARRSPKLTAKLEAAIENASAGKPIHETDRFLWSEFMRQSVMELRRAVDVLCDACGAGSAPLVFAGSGLAASIGARFCASDERIAAAVLAGIGSHGPDGVSPARHLEDFAPRPVTTLDTEAPDLLEVAWPILSPRLLS